MTEPITTRIIGRTVVLGGFVVALAVAGRPVWLAVVLGVLLTLVWAAPLVLNSERHHRTAAVVPGTVPVVAPEEPGPA
jgi:hypothetical protein